MILDIYEYPDPILKKKALPVDKVDDELRAFMDDMLETMYEAAGVGLAAPQVGVSKRIVVIDYAKEEGEEPKILHLVNPEIIWTSEEKIICEEGCLSVPSLVAEVERFLSVRVQYLDYDGNAQELVAEGLLSRIVQHELDHLNGVLYIDRISRLKRNMLVKKLEKLRKGEQEEEE